MNSAGPEIEHGGPTQLNLVLNFITREGPKDYREVRREILSRQPYLTLRSPGKDQITVYAELSLSKEENAVVRA